MGIKKTPIFEVLNPLDILFLVWQLMTWNSQIAMSDHYLSHDGDNLFNLLICKALPAR
jgi:hypothetical protein